MPPVSILPEALLLNAESPVRRQVRLVWQSFASLPLQRSETLAGFCPLPAQESGSVVPFLVLS